MSVAVCLLLYSLVVLVFGPLLLARLTHAGHNPRLGAAAWMTSIASVLVSWAAAAMVALADLIHHWSHPGAVLANCLAALHGVAAGNVGAAMQIGLLALSTLGAAAVAVSAARLAVILLRMRSRTHRHARAVRLVGRRVDGLDAIVLDAPEPAAYCVSGRPNAVVITRAALQALTEPQLAAILAHERAHLDGHHPQIVAVARGVAAMFPNLTLMTHGAHHIAGLLEMCADDSAAGTHGRQPILGGLLALTGAMPAVSGAMGAAGFAVLARAERLALPGRPDVGRTVMIAIAIAIAVGGPLVTALVAASGALCGPM